MNSRQQGGGRQNNGHNASNVDLQNYLNTQDFRNFENKMENKLTSIETSIDVQMKDLTNSQNELKIAIQAAVSKIAPMEHALSEKVSLDAYNSIERRVTKIEESPNGVRGWIGIAISAGGCLISAIISVLSVVLGLVYFFATHPIK